jgi:hypothetical protein
MFDPHCCQRPLFYHSLFKKASTFFLFQNIFPPFQQVFIQRTASRNKERRSFYHFTISIFYPQTPRTGTSDIPRQKIIQSALP